MDPKLNETERTEPSPPWNPALGAPRRRTWRAAEYIAALYVALLLCTPWLVRDSFLLMPPSNGVEIQVVSKALAQSATAPAASASR